MQAAPGCQCKIKEKWHRNTDIDCESILVKKPTLVYLCTPCRHTKEDTAPVNAWDASLYQCDYPLSEVRRQIP